MSYSTHPGYVGPNETWRRFMAGFTVTYTNLMEDCSEWVVRPMTRYHNDRLGIMLEPTVDGAAPVTVL